MALQSRTITVGADRDSNNGGKNYVSGQVIYIKDELGVLAPIFRDIDGLDPIPQNTISNVTNAKGQFTFFIEEGNYIAEYNDQSTALFVFGADYFNNQIDFVTAQVLAETQGVVDAFNQEGAEALAEFDLALDQYKESRGFNTKGTFAAGFTYELPNDVGLDASGNPWILIDTSSLPVTVTAGTTPTNPPFKQVTYGTAAQVSTNTSDTVQSFADSFALKIFQSPTDGLTEIQTRTLLGGEIYEVRKVSDGSFADIYTDKEGLNPIAQNGSSNVSGSDGVVEFYIADEMYYINSDSASSNFNVGSLDSSISIRKLGYKFGEDAKPYILKAATLGYKKIILPKGTIKLSQTDLTSIVSGAEITGVGSGFAYTPSTVIEPFSAGQTDLFISQSGVGGVDNVKFSKFKIEGGFNTDYGIRQLSGAGWEYEDLQGDGCNEWVLWSEQGLNSYNRIYLKPDRALSTGGLMAYSDYFMSKVEVSGGGTGFWLSAGGGRFTDCLSNAQSEQCVLIKPLTPTTNHINTSILGLYAGEVFNALESPIINIENNGASRVRDVQFSNLHTVSAQGTGGEKHNIHCKATNADRVTFNAWQALGVGSFESAARYDAGGLHLFDCNDIKLASGMIYDISKAAIKVENSSLQIGGAFAIKNWGGAFATGKDSAAIQCSDSTSRVSIGNMEFINERVSALKAIDANDGIFFSISTPVVRLFGTLPQNVFEFTSNEPTYSIKQANDNTLYMFGSRCTYKGQFSSTAGGGSFSVVTLPNISQNASYGISIQQVSNGVNATTGNIFTFESTCGVCTTGNTNSTASLQNNFTNSGLDVGVDIGTGYGVTTWQYSITRNV